MTLRDCFTERDIFLHNKIANMKYSASGKIKLNEMMCLFRSLHKTIQEDVDNVLFWPVGKGLMEFHPSCANIHVKICLDAVKKLGRELPQSAFETHGEQGYYKRANSIIISWPNFYSGRQYSPVPTDKEIGDTAMAILSLFEYILKEIDNIFNNQLVLAKTAKLHNGIILEDFILEKNQIRKSFIEEINCRFGKFNFHYSYNNGKIQKSTDSLSQKQIHHPFWDIFSDPKWQYMDTCMKNAIHLRDTGGIDPAFYAAKALESVIKTISNEKGWTTGNEKGAGDFLNHFNSKNNGSITNNNEKESLLTIFRTRNVFAHGIAADDTSFEQLSYEQAACFIENCMSWCKTLKNRT